MIRVVVIGAGLAGLAAALRLAEGGARVTVVAKGAGSLHLSPAVIDVLGYAPDLVDAPRDAMEGFLGMRPGHPYAHLGDGVLEDALAWFTDRVPGMGYAGDGPRNLLLPTAVGVPRPTALAPAVLDGRRRPAGRRPVPRRGAGRAEGLLPTAPGREPRAAALPGGAAVRARHAEIAVTPRPGEADVSGPVFARALDGSPALQDGFGDALRGVVEDGETVPAPAVLGLARAAEVWARVQERAGAPVAEVPTVPPSVAGMRLQRALTAALTAAGVRTVLGPTAVGCTGADGRISEVLVRDAARTRGIPADAVVLATGGFAAGGLELDSHGGLHETVLDLPVSGPPEGVEPLSVRHLDHQPLMAAGVAVDDGLRPVGPDGGVVWANLRAAGSIVAGAEPWREKSGEGIAIAGGYRAAGAILEET